MLNKRAAFSPNILSLHLRGELLIAALLAKLLWECVSLECLDLPMRRSGNRRVGAPEHMVGAGRSWTSAWTPPDRMRSRTSTPARYRTMSPGIRTCIRNTGAKHAPMRHNPLRSWRQRSRGATATTIRKCANPQAQVLQQPPAIAWKIGTTRSSQAAIPTDRPNPAPYFAMLMMRTCVNASRPS